MPAYEDYTRKELVEYVGGLLRRIRGYQDGARAAKVTEATLEECRDQLRAAKQECIELNRHAVTLTLERDGLREAVTEDQATIQRLNDGWNAEQLEHQGSIEQVRNLRFATQTLGGALDTIGWLSRREQLREKRHSGDFEALRETT